MSVRTYCDIILSSSLLIFGRPSFPRLASYRHDLHDLLCPYMLFTLNLVLHLLSSWLLCIADVSVILSSCTG